MRRVIFGAVLAFVAVMAATPPTSAQTVWRMTTEYPAGAIPGEGVATFSRLVTERSGGRVTVQPSYDAGLGIKSAEMVTAVQEGRIEVADAFAGALAKVDPVFLLSSLPFTVATIADAKRFADVAAPAYRRVLAAHGQRLLYTTPWPPSGIWSKTPLPTAQDLAALSIRTYDATSTRVLSDAGARTVELSFADAMPKLKDGTVNAVLSSGDGGAGRRLWDLLPHFAEINYAVPLSIAVLSEKAYGALDPDLRAIVDAAAAETEARQWQAIETRLAENYARMRQNGVTIRTEIDPAVTAALKNAARSAVVEWRASAGPDAAALLDAYERR